MVWIPDTLLLGHLRTRLRPGSSSSIITTLGRLRVEYRIEMYMQEAIGVQSISHVEYVQHNLLQKVLLVA